MNNLYFGDNQKVVRDHEEGECVDVIYPDPPFRLRK